MKLMRSLRLAAAAVLLAGHRRRGARRRPGAGRHRRDHVVRRVRRRGRHRAQPEQVEARHRRRRLGQQRAAVLHQRAPATRRSTAPATSSSPPAGRTRPTTSCRYGSCQYTSARLLTADQFTQTYGRFESRIKIPRGQGIWPAFWMLGNDIGSNPLAEQRRDRHHGEHRPRAEHGARHHARPRATPAARASAAATPIGGAVRRRLPHVRGRVGARPDHLVRRRLQYQRRTPADLGGDRWVFDHPFFMILNVAVGGYWPGYPDGTTQFPQQLVGRLRPRVRAGPRRRWRRHRAPIVGARQQPLHRHPVGQPGRRRAAADSGTATAPARSSGRSTPTARCGRWASAWTSSGGSHRQRHRRSSCAPATAPARSSSPSAGAGDLVNIQANKCVDVAERGHRQRLPAPPLGRAPAPATRSGAGPEAPTVQGVAPP